MYIYQAIADNAERKISKKFTYVATTKEEIVEKRKGLESWAMINGYALRNEYTMQTSKTVWYQTRNLPYRDDKPE